MSAIIIMEDVATYVVILLVHSIVIVGKVIHCKEKTVLVGYTKVIFCNCI